MSADLFEPYEKLITIVVMNRVFEVPENNLLLRQMQFAAPDIGMGRYCWNGECRYCEIEYRKDSASQVQPALACRVKGFPGMQVTKAALEIRYNMSDALAAAPKTSE